MEKEINGLLARLTRFRTSLQETLDNGSQDSGGGSSMWIIYLFSYIYVRYISHISRLPLGIINRYAFSWEDQTLEKALENAKKGISDFDEKMEPITGKKRKADKSANSGTSKKK